MSTVLTDDGSTFEADVTAPDDGDPRNAASLRPALQKLANRTRNSKNRLDILEQTASFDVSGAAIALGSKATLTELVDPKAAYSVSGNEVVLPAVGKYAVSYYAELTCTDTSNPCVISLGLKKNGGATDVVEAKSFRFTGTAAFINVLVSATMIFDCADPSGTDKLSLVAGATGGTVTVVTGQMVIRRIA
jgi:hypothetical protein